MKSLANILLDRLDISRVDYGEARIVHRVSQDIAVRNQNLESVGSSESFGFGVRVLRNGCWGFAACSDLTSERINKTIAWAIQTADAASLTHPKPDAFVCPPVSRVSYVTPHLIDPFSVGLDEKIEFLVQCSKAMKLKEIAHAEAYMGSFRERKLLVTTQGSWIEQDIVECGAGLAAYAIRDGMMQVRSYPSSFKGAYACSGYEFIESLDLQSHGPRIAQEAVELLSAPACPEGETDVIIGSSQMALQIHESIGHATELDRMLGYEASFAGTSFVMPQHIGKLHYGSPVVNVTSNPTAPAGLGTYAFDDEGVPACAEPVIRDGVLRGVLSSSSTGPLIGRTSSGSMRADGWSHFPIIRMSNLNLEPGEWELDDLIADTRSGIFLDVNRSWSIDHKRMHFQFACEHAREIRDGKLGRLFRNPVYDGITTKFWNSCDAVCNANHYRMWGLRDCGKGEPMQVAHVGHGCAPARFRKIHLFSA